MIVSGRMVRGCVGLIVLLAACSDDAGSADAAIDAAMDAPVEIDASVADLTRSSGDGGPPSGPWVAFASTRAGTFDLYLVHPDGTDLHPIVQSAGDDEFPAWSPDGAKLAFASSRSGVFQLYVYDLASGVETAIPNGLDTALAPSWSPDGTTLAFAGTLGGSNGILWLVPASGGTAVPLTTGASRDNSPVWAPDGTVLYFTSDRGGVFDVWSVKPDGSNATQITHGTDLLGGIAVSPDGLTIAYTPTSTPTQVAFYTLASASTQPFSTMDDSEPAFSSDGTRLAMTTARYAIDNLEIVIVDVPGATNLFRLTNSPGIDGQAALQPIR
jgi:Tol biopolymer transport system component